MFSVNPWELVHCMRRLGPVAVTVVLATSIGCAYHMPTSPTTSTDQTPNMTPASIRITAASRTDQKIDVTATVLSGDGHYVANVPLTFSVDAGSVSPNAAVTDANGTARATATTPSATTLHISGAGLSAQSSLPASVAPSAVDAVIVNVPGAGTTGVAVNMFVSSAGSGPWSWSFGDGGTAQTTGLSTSHTYGRPGAYTVTVTGPNGATSSGNITISDGAPGPTTPTPSVTATIECAAAAHGSQTGCHVTLAAADGSTLTANINRVSWDWGDGHIDITPTPGSTSAAVALHTYAVAGSYTITAVVSATGGESATTRTSVTIP